jgi:hypothetical protein
MKRFLMVSALVILLQPISAFALAGGPTLVAMPSTTSTSVGNQFIVTVQMDTKAYQVTGAELHLTFPADRLQALSVQPGTLLPNVLTPSAIGNGTASITVGSGTTPAQGVGSVMVVTFQALTSGSATIAFDPSTQVAAVGQSSNVVDTMTPAVVTVQAVAGSTTPTPTQLPTKIPTPTSSVVGGVGAVSTGPGESAVLALIASLITVLLYIGYAGTDRFRKGEIQRITQENQQTPPDFKQ